MDVVRFESPAARPAQAAAAPARLPFQVGVPRPVTPAERGVLEQIGWEEGDPVPGDLAQQLAAARALDERELAAELRALAASDAPPLAFDASKVVDARALPPKAQADLARKFAEMKRLAELLAAEGPPAPPAALAPGLGAAIAMAAAPPAPPAAPAAPPAAPAAPPPPAGGESPAPSATGLDPQAARYCPFCRHDLTKAEVPEPTEAERRDYLTACLAGARYTRTAEALGGRLRLTFRELTGRETEAIFAQVGRELAPDVAYGQYVARALTYKLAASLAAVERGRRYELPPLAELAGEAPLPALLDFVRDKALPTESLFRVAYAAYGRFAAGLERMEAMAADPDFFGGIPGPA